MGQGVGIGDGGIFESIIIVQIDHYEEHFKCLSENSLLQNDKCHIFSSLLLIISADHFFC